MTGIAVVASAHDAKFAEHVRASLQAAGFEAFAPDLLPETPGISVVLIWSAALEAEHSIDAQALVGLWSEDRLLIARRDETPLPLGLRDLPSLPPGSGEPEAKAEICRGVARKFPVPKKRKPLGIAIGVLVAMFLVGGAWYYFNKASLEKQAALTAALESATKASAELTQAQAKQQESLKALEVARAREIAALKLGDAAKIKEAQEAAKRAEAEAAKQADAVKAREPTAADARKKAQDAAAAAKTAATEKARPEPKAEVAAAPAKAPEPVWAEPAKPEPVAKAEPVKPEPKAPERMSRSEREAERDEEVARKALAERLAHETTQVASAAPAPVASSASSSPAAVAASPSAAPAMSSAAVKSALKDHELLFEQAESMEKGGQISQAIRIYRRAARAGSGKAAKRLGEIYDKGVAGVSRDYAESLQWYETARRLGETVETAGRRAGDSPPTPVPAPVVPAPVPELAKAVAPEPPKSAAPRPVALPRPEKEAEFSYGLTILIGLLVLAAALWWRLHRRAAAEAPQARAERAALPAPQPRPPAARPTAQAGDAAMLFVSYSHKDRSRVEPIVSVIEEMGRRVWMDRSDITGQTGWAGQIVRAIRECRAVVLMASPNSYTSDQVVRELYLAMNHKKAIVPIEIEPAEMPDELQYILAPFHHHRLSGGEPRAVIGRALAAI